MTYRYGQHGYTDSVTGVWTPYDDVPSRAPEAVEELRQAVQRAYDEWNGLPLLSTGGLEASQRYLDAWQQYRRATEPRPVHEQTYSQSDMVRAWDEGAAAINKLLTQYESTSIDPPQNPYREAAS